LAYEGFDYTSGEGLSGQGGAGNGWSGSWSSGTPADVDTPGMTYSGLPTTGNMVHPVNEWQNITRNLDVSGTFSAWQEVNGDGDDVIGKDGTSIWVSVLWKSSNYGRGWTLGLRDDNVSSSGGAVSIGEQTNRPNAPLSLYSVYGPKVDVGDPTGDVELLILEVIFGAGDSDTVNLYRNEDLSTDPVTFVVDASIGGFDSGFYGVEIRTGSGHAFGSSDMDEIRIGETIYDVLGFSASLWDGGGGVDTNWGTYSNWDGDADPGFAGVEFGSSGTEAAMDVSDTVGSVTFSSAGNFDIVAGGGTLTINNGITTTTANSFGIAAPVTLGASQTFDVFDGSSLTVSGAIGDGGNSYGITKTGAGTLTLSGTNTYSGGTTLNGGTLSLANSSALGTGGITVLGSTIDYADGLDIANTIDLQNDATLNVSTGTATQSGIIGETSGSWGITKSGAGTLTLSGTNTYTGGTTINAGTLIVSGGDALADAGAVSIAAVPGAILQLDADETIGSLSGGSYPANGQVNLQDNTLTVGDASNTSFSGNITGTGTLIKQGSGSLKLAGRNDGSFTGETIINAGTVIAEAWGLGTSNITLADVDGVTLESSGTAFSFVGSIAGGGSNGGNIILYNTLQLDGSQNTTFNGVISGTGILRRSGTGTTTLTGNNTYSGGTILGGALILGHDNALGTGTLNMDSWGDPTLQSNNDARS
ncbi:MAG: autotransporter-associated beta strand repeat-containing protein, partial [Chlorobiales bacterium]|nr:autotransporter-associated beta strand repeat-containing protein [Chlorobiales bacterium]